MKGSSWKETWLTIVAALASMARDILIVFLASFVLNLVVSYGVNIGHLTQEQGHFILVGAGMFIGSWILTYILVAVIEAIFLYNDDPEETSKPAA